MMIGVQSNEGTRYPSSDFDPKNQVSKIANYNKPTTSDDEFVDTECDETICSKIFKYEVCYAAETLLKMANDISCSSKFHDSETDFVVREQGNKLGCLKNDDSGLLSNSLCTFSGRKHRLLGDNLESMYFVDNVRKHRRKFEMGNTEIQLAGDTKTITPTIHKHFSFSIIHLMSAVRMALVDPSRNNPVSSATFPGEGNSEESGPNFDHQGVCMREMEFMSRSYLSVDQIVEHVNLRPGDPRFLKIEARLADLVRGTLRVFSSQSPLFGVKGWKQLVIYDKSRKGWCWIGPVPCFPIEQDDNNAECAPEAWGLSKKFLVKMVDCFADWLKTNMNVLKQRAKLPPPPLALSLCKINYNERFSSLLKGKSCSPTIKPCHGEIRAYFHAEERIRYMIPERAYAYTAVDGRKTSVAPVRRCGEKLSTRARDHNLLKCDRPASITILTIVRDAASRLPGGIGTRGDVSVLVRDSQYLVEGISDEQMSQVVSGGLDRLHYERDPCVRFDRQKRLWVYLHGDREEEDFEDDGRQSTIIRYMGNRQK